MTEITLSELKATYKVGTKVGVAAYSVVRKCKRISDGKIFAIQIIKKKEIEMDEESLKLKERELKIWPTLSHPNIVNLHHLCFGNKKIILIMDYCEGGDLWGLMVGHKICRFPEEQCRITFYGICSALQYLHSKYIVHRNIKMGTILFSSKSYHEIKLRDLSMANCCSDARFKTPCGTPMYVAPEILRRETYDTQVDMWSVGVVLYIMLCGYYPFDDASSDDRNIKLYADIKKGNYHKMRCDVSDDAKDLVRKLLQTDPSQRLTAKMALSHPWIFNKEKLMHLISGYIGHESDHSNVLWRMSDEVISLICKFSVYLFVSDVPDYIPEDVRERQKESQKMLESLNAISDALNNLNNTINTLKTIQ